MERLTGKVTHCCYICKSARSKMKHCVGCHENCDVLKVYNRLARYEDTGLELEDLEAVKFLTRYLTENRGCITGVLGRLHEILKAEQDGRLVVLPFEVGGKVFSVKGCFYLPHAVNRSYSEIIPAEVIAIKKTKKGHFALLKPLIEEVCGRRSALQWFPFSSIGKTVFLTREEAEAAQAERQAGADNQTQGGR